MFIVYTVYLYKRCSNKSFILFIYDIYYLVVLKLYSKLLNNNLPHYFSSFTPQISAGQQNHNLGNSTM